MYQPPAKVRSARSLLRLVLLPPLLLALAAQPSPAVTYSTIDYPGAGNTSMLDIDGDNMVGTFGTEPFVDQHGFVFDGVNFAPVEPPGSVVSEAFSIEGGTIVGWADGHGFIFDGADYTPLDHPLAVGSFGTLPLGISGSNIVGWYNDAAGQRAFLYDGADFLPLDYPGSVENAAYGIDGTNIVGEYSDGSTLHGFLFDGTNWTSLDVPGGVSTSALDIEGNRIVGVYYNGNRSHGFLYDGANWTTLDYPDSESTSVFGIDGNRVVGVYRDAEGFSHGFLALLVDILAGDYNENGVVDAADYTTWRDRLGSSESLPNDDSPGVGPDDYSRWKSNFGATLPGGSGSSSAVSTSSVGIAVPEPGVPTFVAWLTTAVLGLLARRMRRQPTVLLRIRRRLPILD